MEKDGKGKERGKKGRGDTPRLLAHTPKAESCINPWG